MTLIQPPGAQPRSASPRAARVAVLLTVLAATACTPEVRSVPAESVTSARASESATPTEQPIRKRRHKAAHAQASGNTTGHDAGPTGAQQVTAGRVTFDAPAGWVPLDVRAVSQGVKGTALLRDVAEELGLTSEQLVATMGAADLLLFSGEGARNGFVDNLSVVTMPGGRPDDEQLRQQFLGVGAQVQDAVHTPTELGDVVSVAYDLTAGGFAVAGEIMMVEVAEGTVAITVSALDRGTTATVAALVRDTLSAAG